MAAVSGAYFRLNFIKAARIDQINEFYKMRRKSNVFLFHKKFIFLLKLVVFLVLDQNWINFGVLSLLSRLVTSYFGTAMYMIFHLSTSI